MRLVLATIALTASLSAAPASAQSLRDVLGAVTGVHNTVVYNGCAYQSGITGALCQVSRATNTVDTISRARRQWDDSRRQDATSIDLRDSDPAVTGELAELCRRGDDEACDAIRSMRRQDQQRRVAMIDRSTMRACADGDYAACDLLRRGRSQQTGSYAYTRR